MQLLKCKWEETAKGWNKEAFFCVFWRVSPFSNSDQSLLLCLLACLMCFCLVLFSFRDQCFESCFCCGGGGGGGVPLLLLLRLLLFVVKLICLVFVFWVMCFCLGLWYSFGGLSLFVCCWVCVCMCVFFWQYVTVVGIWVLWCESFCLLLLLLFVFLLWKEWVFWDESLLIVCGLL